MMERKIPQANVQQAFVKAAVEHFSEGKKNLNVLCIGSFEDTAYGALKTKGYNIVGIDPVVNMDLETFFNQRSTVKASFDIIFSTSVIEHVENDERFISEVRDLLAVDGVAILTMDYSDAYREGEAKPSVDYRLYTSRDILFRLIPRLHNCELVDYCFWQRSVPDFTFDGARYSFASLVFKRKRPDEKCSSFSSFLEKEILTRERDLLMQEVKERGARGVRLVTTHIRQIETSKTWRLILSYPSLCALLLQARKSPMVVVKKIFVLSWKLVRDAGSACIRKGCRC
jgi:SAM-dependent methyltransferase